MNTMIPVVEAVRLNSMFYGSKRIGEVYFLFASYTELGNNCMSAKFVPDGPWMFNEDENS